MENQEELQNGIVTTLSLDHSTPRALHAGNTGEILGENPVLDAITQLLELDDRPSLILDLDGAPNTSLVYCNAALGSFKVAGVDIAPLVIRSLSAPSDPSDGRSHSDISAFLDWAFFTKTSKEHSPSANFWDARWTAKTISTRWRVLYAATELERRRQSLASTSTHSSSGLSTDPTYSRKTNYPVYRSFDVQLEEFKLRAKGESSTFFPARVKSSQELEGKEKVKDVSATLRALDVTNHDNPSSESSFLQFFLQFNWAGSALGPISLWPRMLRRIVNFMIQDPRPSALYWGLQKVVLYNEAYAISMGQKHPFLMGKPFAEAWEDSPQVTSGFLPAFDDAARTGKSFAADDSPFYLERSGYLEENYFSISMIPFDDENGGVAFYNTIFETTRQIISDRRMAFLLKLGQFLAASKQPKDFWRQVLLALETPNLDLPLALLYSAGEDMDDTLSASSEQSTTLESWALEGSVRVPETALEGRRRFGPASSSIADEIPNFQSLITSVSPTLIRAEDGTLPSWISDIPTADGTNTCDVAVFLPIRSASDTVLGFLILALNPHKRFDSDFSIFIELLNRQLATSMASALLLEEEINRSRLAALAAAKDRDSLSRKIEIQSHEVVEIESRWRRMADLAPVGMFHIDPAGVLLYANNDYYTMTEHPRTPSPKPMSWYDVIHVIDHPVMDVEWAKLLNGEHVNFELRLKRPFVTGEFVGNEKVEGTTWIIAAAYTEKNQEGEVVGILGCITDISRQKWSEDFQNRRRLEAIELKRQQENFIDMTSHEMRNPLSAIIQCADLIATSIPASSATDSNSITLSLELLESFADAAQTIVLCAQHQTRIIDDILTLSKLDSNLLVITPVETQVLSVVQTAARIFSGELKKADITFEMKIEESYKKLGIDWVKIDPSRLLQVLINLVTNAIKFTMAEKTKRISIIIGASLQEEERPGVHYLPRGTSRRDLTEDPAWGDGEVVYLSLAVQDTGRGLDDLERSRLFKRFSQSTPRTHVNYGGSGLGLFISKELTEVQGGQIGVASSAGVGSVFAFFVKARRCDPVPSSLSPTSESFSKAAEQTRIMTDKAISNMQNEVLLPRLAAVTLSDPVLEKPSHSPGSPQTPKHVLVVEDNIVNQRVLCKQLRQAGFIVHAANHGAEALAFLESTQYWFDKRDIGTPLSVVLMDVEMPVMDGLTAVRTIREWQKEGKVVGHVPVIACTANARTEQITRAMQAGMDSVVTKPFRTAELVPEIERWCSDEILERLRVERSQSSPYTL